MLNNLYLSHCSFFVDTFINIINDWKLKSINTRTENNKVFFKIIYYSPFILNQFCAPNNSFELIFSFANIINKYPFYFILDPGSHVYLSDTIFISPFIFSIIKKYNYDKKKLINNIKKYTNNIKIISFFKKTKEINSLFKSNVIINKCNPSFDELLHKINKQFMENSNPFSNSYTIVFLGDISLDDLMSVSILNLMSENEKSEIIKLLNQKNINFTIKKAVFQLTTDEEENNEYYKSKYLKYKKKYLVLKDQKK
jgi:hypothetical protein